jgi:regulator of sigma E protease
VTTVLAFLFVLGVLVFVHELGHFVVARLYGVRVLRFSLGFDPKIAKFVHRGTEYSVGIIPLGGFVKLAGETVEDQRTGAPDEFLSKSKWIRFQVYLAGPVMNILLAIVLLTITMSRGAEVPLFESSPAVIGAVNAGNAGARAGLRPGDEIVRLASREVRSWGELDRLVLPEANHELEIVLIRDGKQVTTRITPDAQSKYEVGDLGILPVMRPQLITVDPSGPAGRAGLQRGDVILALDGQQHLDQASVSDRIHQSAGKQIVLRLERNGQPFEVTVVPEKRGADGMIGITISPFEVRRVDASLLQAAQMSVRRNWQDTVRIVDTIRGLIRGQTPMRQLMGPVAIAQLSGSAAQLGWTYLFELMAMISLNLGLINLLPVPVMDGGQIAILGFEGLIRRDLSLRVKERILIAGAALIVMLMATVIYNDVVRLLK